MALKATYKKHISDFIVPGGTSRGVLSQKDSYIIEVYDESSPKISGVGEVSVIERLSIDAVVDLEIMVDFVCRNINHFATHYHLLLDRYPAIRFGLEMALLDLSNGGKRIYFESDFTKEKDSILINGLIWMGDINFMMAQIHDKIEDHYGCLKLKIGANDFESELNLLAEIRKNYPKEQLEIRLDANGAFAYDGALKKLDQIARFGVHSIEQPIKQGDWQEMANICAQSPVKIALDEELIGITNLAAQDALLKAIKPHFIILKPSLIGGFNACDVWIEKAHQNNINYWITSALETNVGLNAISQWSYTKKVNMAQGLGTGKLFSNNFECPLYLVGDKLFHKATF